MLLTIVLILGIFIVFGTVFTFACAVGQFLKASHDDDTQDIPPAR